MQQLVKARYRIRIRPNRKQFQQIMQFAGCSRVVYNHLLSIQKELFEAGLKLMNTKEMEAETKALKQEFDWLKEADAAAIQQSRMNLQSAFTKFFNGLNGAYDQKYGFPVRKTRHSQISYRTPYSKSKAYISGNQLKLPKIGFVNIKTRHIPEFERATSVTIIVEPSGKVYASLAVERLVKVKPKQNTSTGIDLGLESFITLSDGTKIPPFNFAKNEKDKIASMDRKLAKMRTKLTRAGQDYRYASNYQKYRQKVAKYKTHIANKRKDALHKLSTQLVNEYDYIIVEDLDVKSMSKNSRLAYAIQDAGWSMFVEMLEYKCDWYGKTFHKIDRFEPTSTVCSNCGAKHKEIVNSLKVRDWVCPDCGTEHDRDINAALNTLKVGITELFT